jgi:hypothetical protein
MHDPTLTFRPTSSRKSMEARFGLPAAAASSPTAATLPTRKDRWFARLVSAVLEPVWYWLDLYGPDDHPSNTKVLATIAILGGLVIILLLTISFVVRKTEPTVEFYGFAGFIIGGAAAWDSQKTRMKTRAAVDVIRSGATVTTERSETVTTAPAPQS